jgi:S-formylglutathione hydrolase FrmB
MNHGRVVITSFESTVLKANPLKDPAIRELIVYLPPGYDASQQEYPVVFVLPGFASKGISMLNRDAFSEAIDQKLDRLITTKTIKPMIAVIPDCFTYYGGSQYLDSDALGKYETYLIKEIVPHIKSHYRVKNSPGSWAIAGKSSGGYGALSLSMRHPNLFGTFACHSGDMGFEYCYLPDFPTAMIMLEKSGGVAEFIKRFYAAVKKDNASFLTFNILGMAAAYSPNIENKPHFIDLPFDLKTGALISHIWKKWQALDPIHLIETYKESLQQLNIFIDCGTKDEFRLYAGARMFSSRLSKLGIKHIYEEFEDNHMKTSYRYDRSLQVISDFFPDLP